MKTKIYSSFLGAAALVILTSVSVLKADDDKTSLPSARPPVPIPANAGVISPNETSAVPSGTIGNSSPAGTAAVAPVPARPASTDRTVDAGVGAPAAATTPATPVDAGIGAPAAPPAVFDSNTTVIGTPASGVTSGGNNAVGKTTVRPGAPRITGGTPAAGTGASAPDNTLTGKPAGVVPQTSATTNGGTSAAGTVGNGIASPGAVTPGTGTSSSGAGAAGATNADGGATPSGNGLQDANATRGSSAVGNGASGPTRTPGSGSVGAGSNAGAAGAHSAGSGAVRSGSK